MNKGCVFALVLSIYVVANTESRIIINQQQIDGIPQCIWIWYPRYPRYPPPRPPTTPVAPATEMTPNNVGVTAGASAGATVAVTASADAGASTTEDGGGAEATTAPAEVS